MYNLIFSLKNHVECFELHSTFLELVHLSLHLAYSFVHLFRVKTVYYLTAWPL